MLVLIPRMVLFLFDLRLMRRLFRRRRLLRRRRILLLLRRRDKRRRLLLVRRLLRRFRRYLRRRILDLLDLMRFHFRLMYIRDIPFLIETENNRFPYLIPRRCPRLLSGKQVLYFILSRRTRGVTRRQRCRLTLFFILLPRILK